MQLHSIACEFVYFIVRRKQELHSIGASRVRLDSNKQRRLDHDHIERAGDGSVTYSVAPNMSSSIRSGTISVAGLSFTVFQGIQLTDVPVGHPLFTEISKLSSSGVTLGCGVGIYCPDEVVTRQQMAAFIIRALGDPTPPPPGSQRFTDVGPENPFYSFIEQMAIRQITLGCGGGNYCPSLEVSRGQMAAFLVRAFNL